MNQKGAVIVVAAALMFVFIGMAALALDLGNLYLIRNELQNAADAGALAGVRVLYNSDGFVNPEANIIARNAAIANKSQKLPVEVIETEVERGHWSFAEKTFNPVESLVPVTLTPPYSFSTLDSNPDFVNAVRIVTRRGGGPENIPAKPFFSGFWGYLGFNLAARAIAYIGFSQAIEPEAVDKPIAICLQAITGDTGYSCVTGRMINSSGSGSDTNTGGWTNYSQGSDCSTPSANDMSNLLSGCGGSNSNYLFIGSTIGLTNGMQGSATGGNWGRFMDCWKQGKYDSDGDGIPETQLPLDSRGYPTKSWRIKLPIVDCGDDFGPINGCRQDVVVKGTVQVDVVWIVGKGDPSYQDIPTQMDDWSCSGTTQSERIACWNSFVDHFNLRNYDQGGSPTPYAGASSGGGGGPKAVYVKPVCEPLVGPTSGAAFSFFWKNPVLVD